MLEHKEEEVIRANRLLLRVSVVALVLLGPSFVFGYFFGYHSAQSRGSQSVASTSLVASQTALPFETVTGQSGRTDPPKSTGRTSAKPATVVEVDQRAAGQIYLQLVAAPKGQSNVILDELRANGFPALIADVPEKPGLRRVLIGPLHENELYKTRADLQSKGFPGDSAIKRTF
jgi:cell division septation protein DedD